MRDEAAAPAGRISAASLLSGGGNMASMDRSGGEGEGLGEGQGGMVKRGDAVTGGNSRPGLRGLHMFSCSKEFVAT